jgi:hypothetical protein
MQAHGGDGLFGEALEHAHGGLGIALGDEVPRLNGGERIIGRTHECSA